MGFIEKGTAQNYHILSVGGSIVIPTSSVDTAFVSSFSDLIREYVQDGHKFFLVIGGGSTARSYQSWAKHIRPEISHLDLDLIGIRATQINAEFIRAILSDIAYPKVMTDYEELDVSVFSEKVVVGSGWKPDTSSDYESVYAASICKVPQVINLTNCKGVFDTDPESNTDAKLLEKATWSEYLKIVGDSWQPGLSLPFDPVASKLAMEKGISVIVTDGRDTGNLRSILDGAPFTGSLLY